jgi:hypothetical protein
MDSFRNIPESGSGAWKDNVATTSDLPLLNNIIGDKRQALDTKTIYSWDGAGWVAIASPAAAIAITGLLGDVTATGPGAVPATLKTVNLNVGSFGTASSVPAITVNGKGLTTGVVSTPIQIAQSQVTDLVSDLAGKFDNPTGTAADYIAGDGTIIAFPQIGGGGGINYYLNGGTVQGIIGGVTYYQIDSAAVVGSNADFNLTTASPTVSFITNLNIPNITQIPAGNWNLEMYASVSNNTGSPTITASVYKYDGTTFTLIATSLPKIVTDGTSITLYNFAVAIPQTAMLTTDRIVFSITAGSLGGRTLTLHTQNGHLSEILTNIPYGISSINGLTKPSQILNTGTSGVDFNIDSNLSTHTFNLPTASASARGALSSADWVSFNNKILKGTKTIFCIDNGDFATGQAAIDAASAGDTILFGVKQGGWGNLVIPANKTLSLVGLTSPRYPGATIQMGSITFSPTTGLDPNLNELHLCNLYILAPVGSSAIVFGGSAPARLRVDGCYIYSRTVAGIVVNNTDTTSTSARFQDCEIQSSTTTNTHISSASRFVTFNRCNFGNGNKAADVVAGVFEFTLCRIEVNNSGAIVTVGSAIAPTYVSMGSCIVSNTTANSGGVALTQGAQSLTFVNISNVFNIPVGTGYCVSGTGTHAYSYGTFLANSKYQTTLTNAPLTVAPTLAP